MLTISDILFGLLVGLIFIWDNFEARFFTACTSVEKQKGSQALISIIGSCAPNLRKSGNMKVQKFELMRAFIGK